jgi:hypothetical protein
LPAIERFQAMSTSVTTNTLTLIATRAFTVGGVVVHKSASTDIFKFPDGAMKNAVHAVRSTSTFNRSTCAR